MEDTVGALPFTPTGLSVVSALVLIIIYLFRLNHQDRKEANARLSVVEGEHAEAVRREREHRATEREWLRAFYEQRIVAITATAEEQIKGLRVEIADLRMKLADMRVGIDAERAARFDAEEKLAGAEIAMQRLQSEQARRP
jgi:hypothetical protein